MKLNDNIDLKSVHLKDFNENKITFEVDILFKHNLLAPITIDSLSGDLYIINKEIKITSKDKIGKFVCPNSLILKHGKENIIKLDLTLYYTDIFFSNIPKVSFNVEYKIEIVSGNFLSIINLENKCINWLLNKCIIKDRKINLIEQLIKLLKKIK